jgi:hypothetical protein
VLREELFILVESNVSENSVVCEKTKDVKKKKRKKGNLISIIE